MKYIVALFLLMFALSFVARAQTTMELLPETKGITPLAYYELSQEAERLLMQNDYAKAAEAYEKLTKAYPLDGEKWRRLGVSLYQLGKFREAIPAFLKAQEFGVSPYPQANVIYIARSYARAGDVENALIWLEKAIQQFRYNLESRQALLSNPAFESLRSNPRFVELVGGLPKREFTRDEGWRYDIDYLLSEIKRLNAVYSKQPLPDELLRAANHLKGQIPKLSNEQILLEMQHLLVLLRQTHNELFPSGQERLVKLTQLPLTFYAFPEGLYIVDATQGYENLIGARVLRFDGTTAERALELTGYIIPRENDLELLWRGPDRLKIVQWLHALKLTSNPDRVNVTVVDRKGKTRTVSPEPVRLSSRPKLNAPRIPNLPAPPLYLTRPSDFYWFEYLPEDKTLYLQFNQVRNKPDESLSQFSFRVRDFLAKNNVRNLIVDLRRNNGGDTYIYTELLRTLINFDAGRDNRLFVFIGRSTFSATANFITDLDRLTNAVFVGELSGGKPITVGSDESPFVLPYSGVGGLLSSTIWQLTSPRDARLWITPDIPVQLSAGEYFANRDPVMETVLTLIRNSAKQ
jgi:tetratricopeptide (TPR) repeat protein